MHNRLIIVAALSAALFPSLFGCSTSPKGEYPRAKIDRPYALPDDVAQSSFGASYLEAKTDENNPALASSDAEDSETNATGNFEWGIGETVSWIFPIGVRWGIYSNEKHSFGVSGITAFVLNTGTIDYWYRATEWLSVRPYYAFENYEFFFVSYRRSVGGLNLIFQASENWAFSLNGYSGTYESESDFFEIIYESLTAENIDTTQTADLVGGGLGATWAFHEDWDLVLEVNKEQLKFPVYSVDLMSAKMLFNYFW